MNLLILPEAENDLIDAYWFYEKQSDGVGKFFLESITADMERLTFLARVHSLHLGKHRMIASRFPYSIYYLVEEQTVKIYAILDDWRDPDRTGRRLA